MTHRRTTIRLTPSPAAAAMKMVVVLCVVVDVGCSEDERLPPDLDAAAAHGGSGGSAGGGGVGTDAGAVLRVDASATSVCPGECVEVRAIGAFHGTVQYLWQPTLAQGAGPHAFCPSATTELTVTATEDDPEFSSGPHTATTTIVVRDHCAVDAAISDAAITDAGEDAAMDASDAASDRPLWFPPAPPACSIRSTATGYALPLSIAGHHESAYVAGTFMGTVTLGTLSFSQAVGAPGLNAFVVKLDGQCQPVWTRALVSPSRSIAYAVAETDDGSVLVGGSFDGEVRLGGLPLYAPFHRDLFLLKLSADGDFIWQRQYATSEMPGSNQVIDTISIDDNGSLVLSGQANAGTDFGRGALDLSHAGQQVPFAVKLDAQGNNPAYQVVVPMYGANALAQPSGSAVVLGISQGPWSWGGSTQGSMGRAYDILAGVDATGMATWSLLTERNTSVVLGSAVQSLAVADDGSSLHPFARAINDEEFAISFLKVSAAGALLWHGPELLRFFAPTSVEQYRAQATVTIDSAGRSWVATTFDQSSRVEGEQLPSVGPRDLAVLRLTGSGEVDWVGTFGTGSEVSEPRITTTGSGSTFVAATSDNQILLVRFTP